LDNVGISSEFDVRWRSGEPVLVVSEQEISNIVLNEFSGLEKEVVVRLDIEFLSSFTGLSVVPPTC
jgi:hypothetical protein